MNRGPRSVCPPPPVTLAAGSASDVIHYTLDGTAPGAASPVYAGPVPITASTRLRAVARADGLSGAVSGAAWVRLAPGSKEIEFFEAS